MQLIFSRYCFRICLFSVIAFSAIKSFAADTDRGSAIYAKHCSSCHGTSGIGVSPNMPNFSINEGLIQPDLHLKEYIYNGYNAMPAYRGVLNDNEIFDVIAYLRTLSP